MPYANSQLFRFKVERRDLGVQELVMAEDDFRRWFFANGGKLIDKHPLSEPSEQAPASARPHAATGIPTVTIFTSDCDEGLCARVTNTDVPILLSVEEISGPAHTILMPNMTTRVMSVADLLSDD